MLALPTRTYGPTRSARAAIVSLCGLALIAAGCSSDADPSASASTIDSTTTSIVVETTESADAVITTEAAAPVVALSGLDGAIGEAADLALSWFNGAEFTEAAYEASFDQTFRDAISFADLTPLLTQITSDAPYNVDRVTASTPTTARLAIVGESGTRAELSVSVVSPADASINGLFIGPPQSPFEPPTSTDEALERLGELGTLRVATFTDGCVAGELVVDATTQAPIGSAFKLWVLSATVDAVESGAIAWDDEVSIRDELDAYPSGFTQDEVDGSLLSVRELADRMISVSDNTATNHLMDLLGRDAVEQAMIDSGHAEPERNLPLMDAREFTIVKFSGDDLRRRYIDATQQERRDILNNEVASLPLPPVTAITSVTAPLDVELVEWFASPTDLCLVLSKLADNDIAAVIMSMSPGIPDEAGRWESVLFKGGSEPGVIAMAWLTIDSDGSRFVTAGSVANETALIDDAEAANLLAFLRDSIPPS